MKATQSESSKWGKASIQKIPWTVGKESSFTATYLRYNCVRFDIARRSTASLHTLRLHTLLRNSTGLANSSTSRNKLLRMKPLLTRLDWTLPTSPNPRGAFVQISLPEQLDWQWLHGQFLTAEDTSHQFSSHSWDWSGDLYEVYVLDWEKATGMCCSV